MKLFLKRFWVIIVLLGLSLLASYPVLLPGYFPHHDDLQVMRIFEMRRCLEDLQIPCRWVPDMGYGNGFPLFNYYSPLPYYLGASFSFLVGFLTAAKLLFFIPMILGTFSFYLLAKQLFRDDKVVLLAGVLYTLAPYRALDTYVRGAVAESFAMAIAPLSFYLLLKLLRSPSRTVFMWLVISITALMLSHNIMTIFFLPMLIVWGGLWVILDKRYQQIKTLIMALLLGIGLSAFFVIPAYFEKDLVTTETLTRFDLNFRVHFVTVSQLFFDREWGFGASTYGPDDSISFQIGWPLWVLVGLSIGYVVYGMWRRRKEKEILVYGFLLVAFLFSAFMTHNRSAFIWEAVGILQFVQFPWRFLAVTIFSGSLLGAAWLVYLKGRWQTVMVSLLVAITVLLNIPYFRVSEHLPGVTDQQKLTGEMWLEQQRAAVLDYLPKTAAQPLEPAPLEPMLSGKGKVESFDNRSNKWDLRITVDETSLVEVPVFDFPNWRVYQGGKVISHNHDNHLGRIAVNLEPGEYQLTGRFENTPIRQTADLISLISLGLLGSFLLWKRLRIL